MHEENVPIPASAPPLSPTVSRDDLHNAVVTLLWAQAHILSRIAGRVSSSDSEQPTLSSNAFELVRGKPIDGNPESELDLPASAFDISWNNVASTHFAQVMEDLYEFAYFGTFDPRYYPHEWGDETAAWWVALYLKDLAASHSLRWQGEYSGQNEMAAAELLLQIVETANARLLLENVEETFVQESNPGFLTIRELALVSGFKEESLRVFANPKRKNPLPTQNQKGCTVVAADEARRWLQLKGRYMPITPRRSSGGGLNLYSARFGDPSDLCEALSDHVGNLRNQGPDLQPTIAKVRALYPQAYWERPATRGGMATSGLDLSPADLQDRGRLRALATALGLNPDLLELKFQEAELRANLAGVESRIKAQSDR